jgi:hypothetical protein
LGKGKIRGSEDLDHAAAPGDFVVAVELVNRERDRIDRRC